MFSRYVMHCDVWIRFKSSTISVLKRHELNVPCLFNTFATGNTPLCCGDRSERPTYHCACSTEETFFSSVLKVIQKREDVGRNNKVTVLRSKYKEFLDKTFGGRLLMCFHSSISSVYIDPCPMPHASWIITWREFYKYIFINLIYASQTFWNLIAAFLFWY